VSVWRSSPWGVLVCRRRFRRAATFAPESPSYRLHYGRNGATVRRIGRPGRSKKGRKESGRRGSQRGQAAAPTKPSTSQGSPQGTGHFRPQAETQLPQAIRFQSRLPKTRRSNPDRPTSPETTAPGAAGATGGEEAIRLLKVFRRKYPNERPAERWASIYPQVIPGYGNMNAVEQRDAQERLRERVRWRLS
jgi:hypothetical protein